MKIVLYLFEGTYTGERTVEYKAPQVGAHHRGLLFLRQSTSTSSEPAALQRLRAFGFAPASILRAAPMAPESLNNEMPGFAGFYESALEVGETLVWYP